MIGAGVIIALGGLLLIWLSARMRQERLPRNSVAGVRTRATMRSDDAFRIANKAAAPLSAGAGVALAAGGVAAAILQGAAGGTALLAGALTCAALAIAGGIIGARACRRPSSTSPAGPISSNLEPGGRSSWLGISSIR